MASTSLRPNSKYIKRAFAGIIFKVLGKAVKACYRLDSRVKKEFDDMPEGFILKMGIKPLGPELIIKKTDGKVELLKEKDIVPDVEIQFKNIEGGLLALTAERSVAQCYSEQRFIIKGDLSYATAFVRIMNITEAYLFPKIWTTYLFNNQAPRREVSMFRVYFNTLFSK